MAVAVAMAKQQPQLIKARWWYDALPPWLAASNLSSCMTLGQWSLYQALVIADHHQMGAPQRTGRLVKISHPALGVRARLSASAIRQGIPWLLQHGLLDYYRHGRAQSDSWFRIDLGLLREVYEYVCPILEYHELGWRGMERDAIPQEGVIVYGKPNCHPLVVEWSEVQTWIMRARQQRDQLPEVPSAAEIRRIVENYVEKNPARGAGCDDPTPHEVRGDPARGAGCGLHLTSDAGCDLTPGAGSSLDRESLTE